MDIELRLERLKGTNNETDSEDSIIKDYMPFIISRVSKVTGRYVETENDETYLVGLEAFYESMRKYDRSKGRFLSFAELVIRNRLTDYFRMNEKHKNSINYESMGELPEERNFDDLVMLKEEVFDFKFKLASFGLTPDELVDNSPKYSKTIRKVTNVGRKASLDSQVTNKLYETKKLPMARIIQIVDTTKKILKTYRNYIIAVIIVYVENYEMIDKFLLVEKER